MKRSSFGSMMDRVSHVVGYTKPVKEGFDSSHDEEKKDARRAQPKAPQPKPAGALRWKEARDPKTGRTYYYDVVTRETQWNKPMELLEPLEREAKSREKEQLRTFFDEMERNMRKNFESGLLSTDVMPPSHGLGWKPPRMTSGSISSESGSRLLRTLSTYDDSFLEEPVLDDDREALRYAGAGARRRRRSLSPRSMAWSREISELRAVARERSAKRRGEDEVVDKSIFPLVDKSIFPPHSGAPGEASERTVDDLFLLTQPAFHRARNSTGTMFIDHTLASPDKDATIRCVCHVLRAHMAAADAAPRMRAESDSRAREFAVFEDDDYVEEDDDHLPSAAKLVAFYRDVFSRGQLELECIVTSLIYVERLLRATRGRIKLRASNWRPILFAAMVMASKVCDDLSMWNADFGHICRAFDLQRINALEAALLRAYGFNATVPASEYAKYYFHLRSMAARLGLATGADAGPLDVTTARGIALRSRAHYGGAEDLPAPNLRRAMSLGADPRHEARRKVQATLEQIVDMSPTKVAGVTASPK